MPVSLHSLTSSSSSSSFIIGVLSPYQSQSLVSPNLSSLSPIPLFPPLNSSSSSSSSSISSSSSSSRLLLQHRHRHRHGPNYAVGPPGGPLCQYGQVHHLNPFPSMPMSMSSRKTHFRPTFRVLLSPQPQPPPESEPEGSTPGSSVDLPFKDDDDSESETEVEEEEDIGFGYGHPRQAAVERWDVLGLGQAMVDFSGVVDDEFLERLGLEKGTRKLVNHEERGKVLRAMDGCSYKAAAGGSLSNSLVALARLGSQPVGGPVLNIAMAGSVGSDPLGGFYRAKLRRASVNFQSAPVKDGTTGTVIVLTTPDAQRTMLAYQGTSSIVNYDPGLSSNISKTNVLVVEGYLFELPDTIKTITKACKDAHSSGALVAVTASDVSCIERHYDDFWEIIGNYADVVFANSDEARALCNFSWKESPISATRYLSHFVPLVSVTDGPRGSYIGVRGEAVYIPPSPCVAVDTCGAGDAYASGILYSILRGVSDLKEMGNLAARVAAVVVGQQGTRLSVRDAVQLAESFAFHLQNSAI